MNESLARAVELAPLIERVHGPNHPELTRVRELTLALADSPDADRTAELFASLREVTNNYALPEDACEAYRGTYESLAAAEAELVG